MHPAAVLPPLVESKIEVMSGGPLGPCWMWTASVNEKGYGKFREYLGRGKARSWLAHRFVYVLSIGPIPEGFQLDHLCHTVDESCPGGPSCPHRRCVNPIHLEVVTPGENTRRGVPARKTHCIHGHEFTPENTYVRRGQRRCQTCRMEARNSFVCEFCGTPFKARRARARFCGGTCRNRAVNAARRGGGVV